jgi:hypothetical protein
MSVLTICAILKAQACESEWIIWGSQDVITGRCATLQFPPGSTAKHLIILDVNWANRAEDEEEDILSSDETARGHGVLLLVLISHNNRRATTFLIEPSAQDQHLNTAKAVVDRWLPDTVTRRDFKALRILEQSHPSASGIYLIAHARLLMVTGQHLGQPAFSYAEIGTIRAYLRPMLILSAAPVGRSQ